MCSIAGNRLPLLLLISRLKVKQTRREGWIDCATLAASDYLREQKRKKTAPYVDHAKRHAKVGTIV